MFLYKRVYTVASLDTQCIVSNFESERYISRVGRDGPLHTSLPRYVRYLCGTYGTSKYLRYRGTAGTLGKELTDYNTKKTHNTLSFDMERVKIWNGVTASD